MSKCFHCKFYGGSATHGDPEARCYGMPPQIHVTFPNGNEEVDHYRPVVKADDPSCSLFAVNTSSPPGIRVELPGYTPWGW